MLLRNFQRRVFVYNLRVFNVTLLASFLRWKFGIIIRNRNVEYNDMAVEFLPQCYCKIQGP